MAKEHKKQEKASYSIEQIIPESKGYLLVDPKKCTGCGSCMIACSMAHEGISTIAFSRIQIKNDPLGHFPNDIEMSVCKQCAYPQCVVVCPTGALHVDREYLNVRRIDPEKCIGCRKCIAACPFQPTRISFEKEKKKSFKCDLCKDTPYWKNEGKQICVEVCPVQAIVFSSKPPYLPGEKGYEANLRGEGWAKFGLPTD